MRGAVLLVPSWAQPNYPVQEGNYCWDTSPSLAHRALAEKAQAPGLAREETCRGRDGLQVGWDGLRAWAGVAQRAVKMWRAFQEAWERGKSVSTSRLHSAS